MKKWLSGMIIPFLAACMLTAMPMTSLAKTDDDLEEVGSITIDLECSISEGDKGSDADSQIAVDGDVDPDFIEVKSIKVTNKPSGDWKAKDKPKVEIKIRRTDKDYTLKKLSKDDITINGVEVKGITVSNKEKASATIVVTMAALEDQSYESEGSDLDLEVSGLKWESNSDNSSNRTVATWEASSDADEYEIRLYRNDTLIKTVEDTADEYDFAPYMTESTSYRFWVRGMRGTSHGKWSKSGSHYVSSSEAAVNKKNNGGGSPTYYATWVRDNAGWWYRNADGSWTSNNWQLIDGKWYFFGSNGYMRTGWFQSPFSGLWFYLDPVNGDMKTGWIQSPTSGLWYYMDRGDGHMLTNTKTPDNNSVNADGVWTGAAGSSRPSGATSSTGATGPAA